MGEVGMSKEIDATRKSLGELLGRYERRPVVLPEFQRPYSWDKAHVTAFWEDLEAFRATYVASPVTASYFLGSIVVLKSDDQIVLLDGQQRMATTTIALAAIRDVARTLDNPPATKGNDFARDVQRELLEKDTDPVTYSLTLSELDEEFFFKAVKTDPPLAMAAKLRSHQLIEAARDISRARIRKLVENIPIDEALKVLKSLQDALTKGMVVVMITVQTEEDAFNIFETLNDRGLRLSVPDLVLNLLMRRAGSKNERDLVREKWNEIVRQLGRRDISRFLRHMWVSKHGDVKAQGLFAVIKDNLKANKITSVSFAEECAEECETYIALLDQNLVLAKDVMTNVEGLIRYFDVQPALPLLLSAYRSLTGNDFGKLARLAVVQYVRYGLITNQNPLYLESAFYEAARVMRIKKDDGENSSKILAAARTVLEKLNTDDASVELAGREVELERSQASWLMTQLANAQQSKTKELGMAEANLEHVFPQNPGSNWPNAPDLEPHIWHIGNLTILGERLNRKAQNKSFAEKKDQYYSSSEIKMTQELLSYAKWDPAAVKKRAGSLAKRVVQVWR